MASTTAGHDHFRLWRNQFISVALSTSLLAHDCRIGKKRLLKLIARTRADDALALTAAMISPVDPATGTASDRSPVASTEAGRPQPITASAPLVSCCRSCPRRLDIVRRQPSRARICSLEYRESAQWGAAATKSRRGRRGPSAAERSPAA